MKLTAPEIRAAAKWLEKRQIKSSQVSPRLLAQVAKENNVGFTDAARMAVNTPPQSKGTPRK